MTAPGACARFVDQVEELALGGPDGPTRHDLLDHAARCPSCQARLSELSVVVDRLLLLAPSMEPPAGFEARVIERMAQARGEGPAERHAHRRARRLRLAAAAAVLLVVALGAGLVGRVTDEPRPGLATERIGTIVRGDGSVSGQIRLVSQPKPMAIITIDAPRRFEGRVHCQLVGPDWKGVDVGSWSADDIAAGAWAVGITPEQLKSVKMQVLDANGVILATADLDPV